MPLWSFFRRYPQWRLCCAVVVTVAIVGSYGCSDSETSRYDVSGTVTYDGSPVPGGVIMFEPDTSAGNSGRPGTAAIVDGEFDTGTSGEPPGTGPHIVRIKGTDGAPLDEQGLPAASPLFPEYRTAVDLPAEPSSWDFDVPVE